MTRVNPGARAGLDHEVVRARHPRAANAVVIAARTASTLLVGTSATEEPPNPPPVIRAPSAPACLAVSTLTSSSSQETS